MRLSIITINLNNAEGLQKTISSVNNQTFKDFEHIIIDGKSTDNSLEVINKYAQIASATLKWSSEPDSGIYQAMNKGIIMSNGMYILFLNSGDYLKEKSTLEQVFCRSYTEEIVAGDCSVSKNGQNIYLAIPPDVVTFRTLFTYVIPHQSTFFRSDLFKTIGLYSENYKINSDLDFFIKALIIKNCTYIHIPLIITDYNLEGYSSMPENKNIYENERKEIFSINIPHRILDDYKVWELEKKELNIFYWIKSKRIIYSLFHMVFNLTSKLVLLKNLLKANKSHK